jgi:hypothetical protein
MRSLHAWWLRKRIQWATHDMWAVDHTHPTYDAVQKGHAFAIADWTLQLRRLES